jgi:hypothetical protein
LIRYLLQFRVGVFWLCGRLGWHMRWVADLRLTVWR